MDEPLHYPLDVGVAEKDLLFQDIVELAHKGMSFHVIPAYRVDAVVDIGEEQPEDIDESEKVV